jgi:hypothetical protein
MRQTVNQTKARAIEVAKEMGGKVWRSGRYYWASLVAPHADSVIVWPE